MKKLLMIASLLAACGGNAEGSQPKGNAPTVHTAAGEVHILPLAADSTVELVYRGPIPAADLNTDGGEISYDEFWEPEWGGAHFIVYRQTSPGADNPDAVFSPTKDGAPYIPWDVRILGRGGRLEWLFYCGEQVAVCVGPL